MPANPSLGLPLNYSIANLDTGDSAPAGASILALPEVKTAAANTAVAVSSTTLVVGSACLQADPANTAPISIQDVNGNTLAQIAAGQSFTPPITPSGLDLSHLKISSTASGQGAFVSYAPY